MLMYDLILCLGALLIAIGSIGILRLPDVFCRGHALAVSTTLGLLLLLIGSQADYKLIILAVLFQFITIPVSSHAIAWVALKQNHYSNSSNK